MGSSFTRVRVPLDVLSDFFAIFKAFSAGLAQFLVDDGIGEAKD